MSVLSTLDVSPENRLLLLCARIELAPAGEQALRQLVSGELDWDQVVTGAVRHGIPSLIFYHLQALGLQAAVPPQSWSTLKHAFQVARLLTMRQRFETGRLLDALRAASVPVIPLKGIVLRERVYPDPALRPSGDIDLLAPLAAVKLAERVLQTLGYVPNETNHPGDWYRPEYNHHLVPYRMPGREVQVEIHWNLAPPAADFEIDIEGLWQRTAAGQVAGRPVRLLSPEDLLLHLGLHALNWQRQALAPSLIRLRRLVDIAETTRHYGEQLDWDQVAERARVWGGQPSLYLALRVTCDLLDAKCPDHVLAASQPAGLDEALVTTSRRMVLALSHLKIPETVTDNLLHLLLAESVREKLQILWPVLFPSRKKMGCLHHRPPESWRILPRYLLRPFQLLGRYAKTLIRIY